MGGLPILNAKNRQKVQNYRMRSERDELKRSQQERGSSPQPSTSTQPDGSPRFEVEVIRECDGVLVCDGFYKEHSYIGVMLTGDGPDGTPGPLVDAVNRFRLSVSLYQNSPKTDQWISALADRASTNGIQLRKRNFMKTYGRMLCASCMMPVPENEMIPRRHFVDANKRKLLKKPREQPKQYIVAQLNSAPSRHSPYAHASRKQTEKGATDDPEVDSGSAEGNDTGAEVSNGGSPSSNLDGAEATSLEVGTEHNVGETIVLPTRTNKRKAYKPREACNIVMPAGVDPFEPEYDFSAAFIGRESERRHPNKSTECEKKTSKRGNVASEPLNCNCSELVTVNSKGSSNTLKGGKELSKTELTTLGEEAGGLKESEVLKRDSTMSKGEARMSKKGAAISRGEGSVSKESGDNLPATTNRSRRVSVDKLRRHHVGASELNRPRSHSGVIRFKSEKIRDAFMPSYRILKTGSDDLHMKLVRQPSEEEYSASTSTKKNQLKMGKLLPKFNKEQGTATSTKRISTPKGDRGPLEKYVEGTSSSQRSPASVSPTQDFDLHPCISDEVEEANEAALERTSQPVGEGLLQNVQNSVTHAGGSPSSVVDMLHAHRMVSVTASISEQEQLLTTVRSEETIQESACLGGFSRPAEAVCAASANLATSGSPNTANGALLQHSKVSKVGGISNTTASSQHLKYELHNQEELDAHSSPSQSAHRVDAATKNMRVVPVDVGLPASGNSVATEQHFVKAADPSARRPYLASEQNAEPPSSAETTSATSSTRNSSASARPPIRIILKPVKNVVQSSPSVESLPCDTVSILSLPTEADIKPFTSLHVSASSTTSNGIERVPLSGNALVKIENEDSIKQVKMTKSVRGHLESSRIKKELLEESGEVEASKDNIYGLRAGDVVWAKNGTDAFWPGRIHSFCYKEGKGGAAILWFGAATYSPFIDFSRLEPFIDCYANRFNPKRAESNYHKAVAGGIAACLPQRGYFEQKLSLQVHKVLISTHGFDPGEEIKIITKRKRKSAGMSSSHKKRKISARKYEGELSSTQKNEVAEMREVKVEPSDDMTAHCEAIGGRSLSDDEERLIIVCDDE
uniref:PWWP domain-containing protein n=1 Tax=Parascaris univalens TaxID=6257 RepID=A0A914ZEK4_PARUN